MIKTGAVSYTMLCHMVTTQHLDMRYSVSGLLHCLHITSYNELVESVIILALFVVFYDMLNKA